MTPTRTLQETLARLLEDRGWRIRSFDVRCWQDPLIPDGEPVGIIAAIHRELRREKDPHAEIDRALRRELPDAGRDQLRGVA